MRNLVVVLESGHIYHEFYLQESHQILREKLKKIPLMALAGKRGLEINGKCAQSVFHNKSPVSRAVGAGGVGGGGGKTLTEPYSGSHSMSSLQNQSMYHQLWGLCSTSLG